MSEIETERQMLIANSVNPTDEIQIVVNIYNGKSRILDVVPDATIQSIKNEIYQIENIPTDVQTMVFKDTVLDNNQTLQDYDIENESIINLMPQTDPEKELKINKLYEALQEILNKNDFDLKSLKNDLRNKDNEVDEFCSQMNFDIMQKTKFRQLMRLIHDINTEITENTEDTENTEETEQKYNNEDEKLKQFLKDNKLPQYNNLYRMLIKQNLSYDELKNLAPKHIEDICNVSNIDTGTKLKLKTAIIKHQQQVFEKKKIPFHHKMDVILIGNSEVGKTCLMNRFVQNTYQENNLRTFGVGSRMIHYLTLHDGSVMQITIWDTAGQERFHALTSSYYRRGDAILYCYDVSNSVSLDNCAQWLKHIEEWAKDNVFIELVGCKSDAGKNEESKPNVAQKILNAEEWNNFTIEHAECSAKTGQNVDNVFITAAETVFKRNKSNFNNIKKQKSETEMQAMRKNMAKTSVEISDEVRKQSQCFASDSFVITYPNYVRKQINELKIYEKILSYDPIKNKCFWDELLIKEHFEENEYLNNELVSMIEFTLKNNETLTMTSKHLLYVKCNDNNQLELQCADTVKIGDKLFHFDDEEVEVMLIKKNIMKYPRNLLTFNGNLVINGFAISSFCETIKGESMYFGKIFRYVLNNYYQFGAIRYPMYYISKFWTGYIPFCIKQYMYQF